MDIRKASSADKEDIAQLHIASIKRLCANHYSHEQIVAWTNILTPSVYDQALQEKVFLVASGSNQGVLGIGIFDIQNSEISAIYIHPDHIGKGIGAKILREFELEAQANNLSVVSVCSTLNAKGFYLANGYSEQEKTYHELPGGLRLECVKMVKSIT